MSNKKKLREYFEEAINIKTSYDTVKQNILKEYKDKKEENDLKELEVKLAEMDQYMEARLKKVVKKMEEWKEKCMKDILEERRKLNYQLMKAKINYFKQLIQAKEEYNLAALQLGKDQEKLDNQEMELDRFREKLTEEYDIRLPNTQLQNSINETVEFKPDISKEEITSILADEKIPISYEKELEEAVNQGDQ